MRKAPSTNTEKIKEMIALTMSNVGERGTDLLDFVTKLDKAKARRIQGIRVNKMPTNVC
jgi:hypothetical protein